jgi:hypothetical protein
LPDGCCSIIKTCSGFLYFRRIQPNLAVDEDIKTYWSAKTGNAGEWFQTDLGDVSTVNAIQINYADQDAEFLGKTLNKHQ